VLDGAPSHRSEKIVHPENVSLLELPAYSPELDPAQRWFQEFRRKLSNRTFESVALMQEALTRTLLPYWKDPALLKNGSPDTLGGWRHCDINSLERYYLHARPGSNGATLDPCNLRVLSAPTTIETRTKTEQ
jgi:hypothetical protein